MIAWVGLAVCVTFAVAHLVVAALVTTDAPLSPGVFNRLVGLRRLRGETQEGNATSSQRVDVFRDARIVAPAGASSGSSKTLLLSDDGSVGKPAPSSAVGPQDFLAELRAWEASDENNAKFPGPREGDIEHRSKVADILAGRAPAHEHGLLGRNVDGTEVLEPTPLPASPPTEEEFKNAHKGFCYDSRVSDSLSVDRPQRDMRSPACKWKHMQYPKDLPKASVVIVFHNELLSALARSVHSVLNHSPPHLLREVIVVDDASHVDPERWDTKFWRRLQDEWVNYAMTLPKVTFVRLKERRGLMMARMEGIWRATSEVVVVLDSHIEATPGYLEPMLARIKESGGKTVVVPSIDSVHPETFAYDTNAGLGVMSFSWWLGQAPTSADLGPNGTDPALSPAMAGGLFATDRKMFLRLGGYDPDMRVYGGEEMEIGFRTWMCGGAIEYVPCSRVGHIFRNTTWGQAYAVSMDDVWRNRLRTAAVWMDKYVKLVELAAAPLPPTYPLGDLDARRRLREKLQCKDFAWYLRNVVPSFLVPKIAEGGKDGWLRNDVKTACLDTLGETKEGALIGVYPCHYQHGSQAVILDTEGLLRLPQTGYHGYEFCMSAMGALELKKCASSDGPAAEGLLWRFDDDTKRLVSRSSGLCLTFVEQQSPKSPYSLTARECEEDKPEQQWVWGRSRDGSI